MFKTNSLVRNTLLTIMVASGALATHAYAQQGKPSAFPPAVWAVTATSDLIQINSAEPNRVLQRKPLKGLAAGETLVGIDYRVSRGVLYGLAQSGRLFTINTATGELTQVGTAPVAGLQNPPVGFDFNPAADRIRVVSSGGQNLRLHPDTGAQVDFDPKTEGLQADGRLAYAAGDIYDGKSPDIVAAAYTYNKTNAKVTTNYAIDRTLGVLVMQGSHEDVQPVVSPNLGQLKTIGRLGLGPLLDASFDISDLSNTPLAVVRSTLFPQTRLFKIDLATGAASVLLGTVGTGEALTGLAIEP